jgi:putative tryptophan/tyrosine transport system substrate-binding protein
MSRREFIAFLAGVVVVWPRTAHTQQSERVRRIGGLFSAAAPDPETDRVYRESLQKLGWTDGRNVHLESRLTAGDPDRLRTYAVELVGLSPDVIVAGSPFEARVLAQQTQTIPIVFAVGVDPVGQGLVGSLAHPGGNITGCSSFEFSMGGKWVAMLREIAPQLKRLALVFNPEVVSRTYLDLLLRSTEVAASSLGVEIAATPLRIDEIEGVVSQLGREPGVGLIVPPDVTLVGRRSTQLQRLAAQYRLPAVWFDINAARYGDALLAYGPNLRENYRCTATYVDRILRGAKPADLPVQAPIKFELIVNLKAAKTIGLAIPEAFLARADEVIE